MYPARVSQGNVHFNMMAEHAKSNKAETVIFMYDFGYFMVWCTRPVTFLET